jgi:hypothetical protein
MGLNGSKRKIWKLTGVSEMKQDEMGVIGLDGSKWEQRGVNGSNGNK